MQLFCDEERGKIKGANPDAAFGTINCLLAAAWKEAGDDIKKHFMKKNKVE
jgi:hypothetical protein